MKFVHKNYNPPEKFEVLPNGRYSFKVMKIEEKFSKTGNPMLKLTLKLNYDSKPTGISWDYLVDSEDVSWKRKHFLESLGLGDLWDKHEITITDCDLIMKANGICEIIQETMPNGAPTNKIKDYIKALEQKMIDDNLPF